MERQAEEVPGAGFLLLGAPIAVLGALFTSDGVHRAIRMRAATCATLLHR